MTKVDQVEKWLYDHIGCGYVFGATGWICTPSRRAEQAKQYPQYADTIMRTCAKWDGKQCFDCAQLVAQAMKQIGVTNYPSGATSLWNKVDWADRGTIDTVPDGKLVCLFRDNGKGTKEHVGWRLRSGDVIDARGSDSGVVLNKRYTAWTHWAEPPGLNTIIEESGDDGMTCTVIDGRLALRSEPSTAGKLICWMPKGEKVKVLQSNNDWSNVTYNGITGYAMTKFLSSDSSVTVVDDDVIEVTLTLNYREATMLRDALNKQLGVG